MKRYYINFDTKNQAPHIEAVFVELGKETIRDMGQKLAVNLADHPQYAALHEYCKNNPPSR